MKKTVKTIISVLLTAMLTLSLASCSIFEAMRENALLAQQFVPEITPEETQIKALFNEWLENSKTNAKEIKENISYSIGNPDVFKAGEEAEAGLLDAAAKQIKDFIKTGNPGSAEYLVKGTPADENVKTKDLNDTLLFAIDEGFTTDFTFTRNETEEIVTDEKGNEKKDENGEVIKEIKNADNILHLSFNCYEVTNLEGEEFATNEDGEPAEETTYIYKDAEEIEEVFGAPLDKQEVIKNFDNIKDYINVLDYEIEYTNCRISADADLLTNVLTFVNFQKEMKVTAKAECVGALSSYGEVDIVFTLTQSTNYEFTYDEAALNTLTTAPATDALSEELSSSDVTEAVSSNEDEDSTNSDIESTDIPEETDAEITTGSEGSTEEESTI